MDVLAHRAPSYVVGPLMGMLILGLRAVLNKPFGALGGYIDVAENLRTPSQRRALPSRSEKGASRGSPSWSV